MSAVFGIDQARDCMHKLLGAMVRGGGSDLFISADFPPSMKANGEMRPLAEKIREGEIHEIKSIMSKSRELGMMTFDDALFDLYDAGHIAYEEAMRNADSTNELRLNITLKSRRGEPAQKGKVDLAIQ